MRRYDPWYHISQEGLHFRIVNGTDFLIVIEVAMLQSALKVMKLKPCIVQSKSVQVTLSIVKLDRLGRHANIGLPRTIFKASYIE